jgi:hypothetical protein
MKYYFLASYLPEIQKDDLKIKFTVGDLIEERFHIPGGDWQDIEKVLLGRDILILEKLLLGKTVSLEQSLFDIEFWRDQIKSPKEGPEFLLDFLRGTDLQGFGAKDVDRLYAAYYDYVLSTTSHDFLRGYFSFQKDLRNVLAALRAREKRLAPSEYLIGEGDLVNVLGSSTAEDFGLTAEYPWLERLMATKQPHQRQDVIDGIIWEYLDENVGPDPFDFRAILAYLLKLEILQKRLALSEEKGMEKVLRLGGL